MAMVGAVGGGLAAVTMALSVAAVHIIHIVRVRTGFIGVNVGGGLGGGGEESRKSAKTQPRGTCTLWVS